MIVIARVIGDAASRRHHRRHRRRRRRRRRFSLLAAGCGGSFAYTLPTTAAANAAAM